MRYCRMDPGNAKSFLQKRRDGNEPTLDGFVESRGDGDPYPQECIAQLQTELRELKKNYPERLRRRDVEGGRFEAESCHVVHRCLVFDAEAMSDPGFWIWLAVAQLSDIVEWRHGEPGNDAALHNYGIGGRVENLFFRMWLRAEIVYDDTATEPYGLATRGDQDFWRSHILRQSYANVRPLARELVRFLFPRKGKVTLDTDSIRSLAKQLRRIHANLLFEALDQTQLRHLVETEGRRIAAENKSGGVARGILRRRRSG